MNSKNLKILFGLILIPSLLSASGWTQKKGTGYFQLSSQVIRANEFYEPGGNKIDITTFGDYTVSLYAEYGLTDRLTAYGSFPFIKRLTLNRIEGEQSGKEIFAGDSKTGVADFYVGLRYGLGRIGNTSFAASIHFGIPVGDNEQPSGLYTGGGEFNQQISLGVGHSFSGKMYGAAKVGYNNRNEGYSDEIRYNLEIGYRVLSNLLFILKANGVETMRNGSDATLGGTAGLFANNQQYLAYGPEIIYSFNDMIGLNAGVYSATRAENVVAGLAYKLGFFYKLGG